MLEIRTSSAQKINNKLKEEPRKAKETNTSWLARCGVAPGDLILLGGTNLTHFRLRVAQSDIRHDLLPSYWSHIALVEGPAGAGDWRAWEVSLEGRDDVHLIPGNNGVRSVALSAYGDPEDFPNIARLRVPPKADAAEGAPLAAHVAKFQRERLSIHIPALMTEWYGWVWGVPEKCNPLARAAGIPSAVFVEAVYAMLGVELTPGLASQSSCPEAIWQSARWWHEFYDSQASMCHRMAAVYCTGQKAAAVRDELSKGQREAVRKSLFTKGVQPR